ncbi:MAG TPA: thiamine-phosphate kinase [Candidatus Acidoferrales bacterium]
MARESQLVEKIARALSSGKRGTSLLRLGIGDDAAVLSPAADTEWVLSCDAYLEHVHFEAKTHPPDSVGYKSLARATSDLAAMGATPQFFLLTLALPSARTGPWLDAFLRGLARASRELRIAIIGGDTTKSDRIFISITVLGEITPGRALTRSGARHGDIIYVSGKLGRAQLGLELVLRGHARDRQLLALVGPHLYPKIRVELGSWLAQHRIARSAMDLSDGLSTDLARLCIASKVGAKIYASKVPSVSIPSPGARKLGQRKLDPLQLALHGGEDYELLFTVSPRQAKKLSRAPGAATLTPIGEITRNREVILVAPSGRTKLLKSQGWDPFR